MMTEEPDKTSLCTCYTTSDGDHDAKSDSCSIHRKKEEEKQRSSEVALLLAQIQEEYDAALNGMSGLAQGTARHHFITTRMENMGKLSETLNGLVKDHDQVMAMIIKTIDQVTPDS